MGADGRQIELGKLSLITLETALILSYGDAQCAYGVADIACFYITIFPLHISLQRLRLILLYIM